MPKVTLTDRAINRKPPQTGTLELWDTVTPGLALRIGYGGRRSYMVTTRVNGKQVRRKVGTTMTHSLAQARDAARNILRDAARGLDTGSKAARKRAAERSRQEAERAETGSFRSIAEAWLADTGKGGGANRSSSYKKATLSQLERDVFPKLGALPAESITRGDIRALVEGIARERPIAANRGLAVVRRVLNWAVAKDKLAASPAVGIEAPSEEQRRERVLSNAEVAALWSAADQMGSPFGPVFQLLLLTGGRRNEVGHMVWSEIEGDIWSLPGTRTKNKRPHRVPLSTVAMDIINAIPQIEESDFVFSINGRKPVSSWGHFKERMDSISGVTGWRLHDLRRTAVTGMAEMGISPDVIELAVNHISGTRGGIAGIYNRSELLPQRRAALEAWAQHIMGIVGGDAEDNVVEMRPAP
jgi:integrase